MDSVEFVKKKTLISAKAIMINPFDIIESNRFESKKSVQLSVTPIN